MIVVTGGAGFIGSAFVWKLNQQGLDNIIIVDELSDSEKWKNLVGLKYADYIHKDDFIQLISEDMSFNVDAIIHMGACSATTETDGDYLMENNYKYTQILADWAIENDAYFMYASSAATYGDGENGFEDDVSFLDKLKPINRYGYSKHLFDLYAERNQLWDNVVGLKFFNVFGPNEHHKESMRSVMCKAYPQVLKEGEMHLFKSYNKAYKDGEQKRDFIYIKDVINIMWWLFENRKVTGLYNVGTGGAKSWNDVANAMFKAINKPSVITYIDMPEQLRGQYQYFTEAPMSKLTSAGCPVVCQSLEASISDYIHGYLSTDTLLT